MPKPETMTLLILVKASPLVTKNRQENVCVAALRLDSAPEWIRLYPVPFRDLIGESKFSKHQKVTVDVVRPTSDRRPESWTPIVGSIKLGETLGTDHGWSTRRERVDSLGEDTMCDLIKRNKSGSGTGTPSLSVVRTVEPPKLVITKRDKETLDKWQQWADAIDAESSLFDDPAEQKPKFEVTPWRFRYHYRCLDLNCNGHEQTIVDWEANALWRNVRHRDDWRDLMRQRFVDEMWAPNRDSVLFAGNMEQHPQSFLVLGVFWPPRQPLQPSLLE